MHHLINGCIYYRYRFKGDNKIYILWKTWPHIFQHRHQPFVRIERVSARGLVNQQKRRCLATVYNGVNSVVKPAQFNPGHIFQVNKASIGWPGSYNNIFKVFLPVHAAVGKHAVFKYLLTRLRITAYSTGSYLQILFLQGSIHFGGRNTECSHLFGVKPYPHTEIIGTG